ncbi:MAG: hypothetical protein IPM16_15550 [Chloroflexi bacterium]|nr:hypothetical protein [Chloroflexota bacterium]
MGIGTDLIIGIISTFAGVAIALGIERARRPRLEIAVGKPFDFPIQAREMRVLRLTVCNRPLPRVLLWFYQSEPAMNCVAQHEIFRPDGTRLFMSSVTARWSGSPEPELIERADGKVLWKETNSEDLPPASETSLDVVVRREGSQDAFPFVNASYTNPRYELPNYRIPHGTFLIKTTIRTGGRTFAEAFHLSNDSHLDHFRIERVADPNTRRQLGL